MKRILIPLACLSTLYACTPKSPIAAESTADTGLAEAPMVDADSPTKPQVGEIFAVIGEGQAPDDGAGYRLMIGVAAAQGSGFVESIQALGQPASCQHEVSSALRIEIEDRPEFHQGEPIELPHNSQEVGKGDWLNAMSRCGEETTCAEVKSGMVHMEELVPGRGAKGRYRFQTATELLEGDFIASWCGPISSENRAGTPQP